MQSKIGMVCGLSLGVCLAVLVSGPAKAAKPVAIEKELLGVRILQNYRQVLARYGAPTRIFRATEPIHVDYATNLQGEQTGGVRGLEGASSSGGGPGGGGGSYPGAPGGSSGYPGSAMPPGSSGYPGAPGSPGGSSGYPGASGGGGGSASGDNPDATFGESGGFTWAYLYPGKELAYIFSFNKDGRIESIIELGRGYGQHTSRGIGLGDTIDKVYSIYGWTDRVKEEDSNKFSLLYNDRYHVHFVIIKNKVVGISVFLKENEYMRLEGGSGTGGSGGGGGKPTGGPVASGGGGGKGVGAPSAGGGGGRRGGGAGSGRAD